MAAKEKSPTKLNMDLLLKDQEKASQEQGYSIKNVDGALVIVTPQAKAQNENTESLTIDAKDIDDILASEQQMSSIDNSKENKKKSKSNSKSNTKSKAAAAAPKHQNGKKSTQSNRRSKGHINRLSLTHGSRSVGADIIYEHNKNQNKNKNEKGGNSSNGMKNGKIDEKRPQMRNSVSNKDVMNGNGNGKNSDKARRPSRRMSHPSPYFIMNLSSEIDLSLDIKKGGSEKTSNKSSNNLNDNTIIIENDSDDDDSSIISDMSDENGFRLTMNGKNDNNNNNNNNNETEALFTQEEENIRLTEFIFRMALSKNAKIGKNILNDLLKSDANFKKKLIKNANELSAKSRMEPLITPQVSPRPPPAKLKGQSNSAKNILPKDYGVTTSSDDDTPTTTTATSQDDEKSNSNNNSKSNGKGNSLKKLPMTPLVTIVTSELKQEEKNEDTPTTPEKPMAADSKNHLQSPETRMAKVAANIELTDKIMNKLGKNLVWWLAAIISRANEPHFSFRELNNITSLGINGDNVNVFIESVNVHLCKTVHLLNDKTNNAEMNKNASKFIEAWKNVSSQLSKLLICPICEYCKEAMERAVPSIVKPCKIPNVYGVNMVKQSREDLMIFCKECHKSLENDDLFYQCSEKRCGPHGCVRIIKNGKLKGMQMTDKGSSVCMTCAFKQES